MAAILVARPSRQPQGTFLQHDGKSSPLGVRTIRINRNQDNPDGVAPCALLPGKMGDCKKATMLSPERFEITSHRGPAVRMNALQNDIRPEMGDMTPDQLTSTHDFKAVPYMPRPPVRKCTAPLRRQAGKKSSLHIEDGVSSSNLTSHLSCTSSFLSSASQRDPSTPTPTPTPAQPTAPHTDSSSRACSRATPGKSRQQR